MKGLTRIAVCTFLAASVVKAANADFIEISNPTAAYVSLTTLLDFPDPDYTVIHSLSDSNLTITYSSPFNGGLSELTVPTSWSTWCSPPACETSTPRVGYTQGEDSETLTFSQPLRTFGLEIEPDTPGTDEITATFYDGTNMVGVIDQFPNGTGGGLLYAASTTTSPFTSVLVTDLDYDDFSIARQRYAIAPTPEPSTFLTLGLGLFALFGWFELKTRPLPRRTRGLLTVLVVGFIALQTASAQTQYMQINCGSSDQTCLNAITVGQISFTYSGAEWVQSQYGILFLDFASLNALGYTDGFINVVQFDDAFGTNPRWIIQNMPIINAASLPGIGTLFDLGSPTGTVFGNPNRKPVGPQSGPIQYPGLQMAPAWSKNPLQQPPALLPNNLPFTPQAITWNAAGLDYGPTYPPNVPRPATPALPNYNPLNGQTIAPVILTNTQSVQQAVNQCAPAAFSNSLDYLSELGIPVDANTNTMNCPGTNGSFCPAPNNTVKSRVGLIDTGLYMGRVPTPGNPNPATPPRNMLIGKLAYIGTMNLAKPLTVKHQGIFCDSQNKVCTSATENFTVNNVTSMIAGAVPTVQFIMDEIVTAKADLELGAVFSSPNGLAGHAFNVIGFGATNGLPYIIFRQDAAQGDNTKGTGFKDGGFIWTYLVPVANNQYLAAINYVNGGTAWITIAIAEEPPK